MTVVIQMTEAEEAKALAILLRQSSGTVLPNRTYVIGEDALRRLRAAGINFRELSYESAVPSVEGVGAVERI